MAIFSSKHLLACKITLGNSRGLHSFCIQWRGLRISIYGTRRSCPPPGMEMDTMDIRHYLWRYPGLDDHHDERNKM